MDAEIEKIKELLKSEEFVETAFELTPINSFVYKINFNVNNDKIWLFIDAPFYLKEAVYTLTVNDVLLFCNYNTFEFIINATKKIRTIYEE